MTLDCAEWCGYAKECVGGAAGRKPVATDSNSALAKRLLDVAEGMFGADSARLQQAVLVFQHAWELLSIEPCDARVVLAAALFIVPRGSSVESTEIGPAAVDESSAGLPEVTRALNQIGFDESTTKQVREVVTGYNTGEDLGTIEFQLVLDAATLSLMTAERSRIDRDKLETMLRGTLRTNAGRQRAQDLFGG